MINPLGKLLILAMIFCALAHGATSLAAPPRSTLRMNQVLAKGTHNSYHAQTATALLIRDWNYTHQTLAEQLDSGVRQLELDVHLKTDNSFYVQHVGLVDPVSSCRVLTTCLLQIRAWSKAHPTHAPLLIWLELKDKDFDNYLPDRQKIAPHFDWLETDVKRVFSASEMITPDLVRGPYSTLPEAIARKGWPLLEDVRGKVMFAMLGDVNDANRYFGTPANLGGKLFFTNARSPKEPYAAFFKIDDPIASAGQIHALVQQGFVVTVLADQPGNTDAVNRTRSRAAVASGAQYISTNYVYSQRRFVLNPQWIPMSVVPVFLPEARSYLFNALYEPICNPLLSAAPCKLEER